MFLIEILVAILAVLAILFYVYRKCCCHCYFKNCGIPGPEPNFLFGNMLELWTDENHKVMQAWQLQYGDIFGYYEGSKPVLVVSSLEAIENVCTQQTSVFSGRMAALIQPDSDVEPTHPLINMMIAKGERWRRPRVTVSRFFSASRRDILIPCFESRIGKLLKILENSNGQPFEVAEALERFAMESIGDAALGLNLDLLKTSKPNGITFQRHDVYSHAKKMMQEFVLNTPFSLKIVSTLPEIIPIIKFMAHFVMKFRAGPLSPFVFFFNMISEVIERELQRGATEITGGGRRNSNLLRLLVDATRFNNRRRSSTTPTPQPDDDADDAPRHSRSSAESDRYMSEHELRVQLVMFFLSGYETTGIALTFLCSILARHPHIQDQLFNEIQTGFPSDETKKLDYDTLINKMPYLDCVCRELLRLYPVAINAVNRLVSHDTTICGVPVSRNLSKILINVWSVHMDAELWGDHPDQFRPERFSEIPNHLNRRAFLTFGSGPHHCIGRHFSMVEMKFVIVNILKSFKILPLNEAEIGRPIPVKVAIVMTPKIPVRLIFQKR